MTDTEQKALALVNEVRDERGYHPMSESFTRKSAEIEALCRAIEQHEAFRQEVSDVVEAYLSPGDYIPTEPISRFIIAKPDPLVEVLDSAPYLIGSKDLAAFIRAAIEKRGGKIVWGESHD